MCATHATLTSHPTRNCTEAHASAVCRCSLPGQRTPEIPQTLYRYTKTTAHAAAASATRAVSYKQRAVRDLRSRSAYRAFSLTAVRSRPSVSSKQRAAPRPPPPTPQAPRTMPCTDKHSPQLRAHSALNELTCPVMNNQQPAAHPRRVARYALPIRAAASRMRDANCC